jgi:predicted transcriptional regulator
LNKTKTTDKNSVQGSSNVIENLFGDALIKIKADASQEMTWQRETFDSKVRQTQEEVDDIKTRSEKEILALADHISHLKAELVGRKTMYEEDVSRIGMKFTEQISKLRTEVNREMIEKANTEQTANRIEIEAEIEGEELIESSSDRKKEEERVRILTEQRSQLRLESAQKRKTHQNQLTPANLQVKDETEKIKALAVGKRNDSDEQIVQIKTHITHIESEFAEVIVKQKAEFQSQNSERKKEHSEQIAILKSEAEEKQKAHANEILAVNAEKEDAISQIKADYQEKIREIETDAYKEMTAQKKVTGAKAAEVIAAKKTNAEATVTELRTQAEIREQNHDEKTADIKAEVEERARILTEQITQLKAEAAEKRKEHEGKLSQVNSQTEETVKAKSQAEDIISELTEQIALIKNEVSENLKTYEEQVGIIKTEADTAIAQQKADSESQIKEKDKDYCQQIALLKAENKKSIGHSVSKAIEKMSQSSPNRSSKASLDISAICSKDIMQRKLVWGNSEDSVQQTLNAMKQYDVDYVMIGSDGVLEGIVSKSDLNGAVSPFLRPKFAKWRRPLDDASLQIKVKWIMSSPVRTIRSQTPLVDIIKVMTQHKKLALTVMSKQGKTLGLVTQYDIYKAILKQETGQNAGESDKTSQAKSAIPISTEQTKTSPKKTDRPTLVTL